MTLNCHTLPSELNLAGGSMWQVFQETFFSLQNNNLYFITFTHILLHVSTYLVHHKVPAVTKTFDVCGSNPHKEDDLNEGIQNDKFGNKSIHDNSLQERTFDAFVPVHSSIVSDKLFLLCDCLYYTVYRDYQKHPFFIRYVALSLLSSQFDSVNHPTTPTYSFINRPGLVQQANSGAAQRARSHPIPIIKTV
jgi:hypothetical protein